MKILVLGAAGQIGQYLVEEATWAGVETICSDIKLNWEYDLRVTYNRHVREQIRAADLVYFLACDVGGARYLAKHQNSYAYLDDNIKILRNTFQMLHDQRKSTIFASSQMSNMVDSPYGMLKRIGEFYANSIGGINVRFWNVYGVEDDPEKAHVITDCIKMAQAGDINLRTDGTEQRQFLYGSDAARALLELGRRYAELERGPNVYYDITSFEWTTIRELADLIAALYPGTQVNTAGCKDTTQTIRNEPTDRILEFWQPTTALRDGIVAVQKGMTDAA